MSYILDALKKSEQELNNRHAPGLETFHGSPVTDRRPGRALWIGFPLVLIILNGAFYYWFTRPGTSVEPNHKPPPVTAFIAPRTPVKTMTIEAPVVVETDKISFGEYLGEGLLITPQDFNRNIYRETEINPVRIAELPANVQRQIPDMKISSHIYASDPSSRVVNINNRSIREGDFISDEIKLVGITEDGIILSYLHYTFEMSVIRDWSFD